MDPKRHELEQLRREALHAARGLTSSDTALADVLRDLEQERSRATQAYHAVLRSLAAALEARDGYDDEHANHVHDLSASVAERLGLAGRAAAEVEVVALLHDIGKIGVPDAILHKRGPLTADEWALMREHPVVGERILRPLPGLDEVAAAVRHEHERWDGSGYPDGLAGEAIPIASRIVLACDAFHALVSDRPYRSALSTAEAGAELHACAGTQFDPQVVEALLACLDETGMVPPRPRDGEEVALALTPSGHEAPRLERELRALIAIASAVGAAHRLEDVVEIAAEQALQALGAVSFSISRWEPEQSIVRTMINVGELAPHEQRLPADEHHRLEDGELVALIEDGNVLVSSLDDADIHPLVRQLLERSGRHHVIAVGVTFGGQPWGTLWGTRGEGDERFDERDARFLRTVADQIAAAMGRAEVFSRMAELAFEDPLTGVANRRALDERLEQAVTEALERGDDVAVLLCDLDNLKELNDARGHHAGDRALIDVAVTLRAEAGDGPGVLVARVGGDEFAVLLEGGSADQAHALGLRLLERLGARDTGPLTVSCGVASIGLGAQRAGDLLRAADAAQYTAKRGGRARVTVADVAIDATWRARSSERRAIRGRPSADGVDVAGLLTRVLDCLDGPFAVRPALDRLEAACLCVAEVADATALAISRREPGSPSIVTGFTIDRRTDRSSGRRFWNEADSYAFDEFPATAAVMTSGGSFIVRDDDPTADPAEALLLTEFGMHAVLAVGVPDADGGGWLVEIYADALTCPLDAVEPALRLLAAEAVRSSAGRPTEQLA